MNANNRNTILSMLLAIAWLLCLATSGSAKNKYGVETIPPSFLPAKAIVRENIKQFDIYDVDDAIYRVTYAVTIFSKEEQEKGKLLLSYNKYITVEELEGTVYDSVGNEVKELDDEDIEDYSAIDNYTLHDDSRIQYTIMYHNVFPYTVVYTYQIHFGASLHWPDWYARTDEHPVEFTSFTVTVPKDFVFRYWTHNDSSLSTSLESGKRLTYRWHASLLPGIPRDEVGGDISYASAVVKIAPERFTIEDTQGSMKSWEEFGRWYFEMKKDKSQLPPSAKKDVDAICHAFQDTLDIIQQLYHYMQSKTRYVSVQLGIGGWKPFDAEYVHSRSYGDCKALTNYMESLLRYAGIPSYHVLIQSGASQFPMIVDFPSNQFNHALLCVPTTLDTIWLECTSQSLPFGTLGYGTENRSALLITEKGGIVVRTPRTTSKENTMVRNASVSVQSFGNAVSSVSTVARGNELVDLHHALINTTKEERYEWYTKSIKMPNIQVSTLMIHGLETKEPEMKIESAVSLTQFASRSGSRLFFNPNIFSQWTYIPPDVKKRLSPVKFSYPFTSIDTIIFKIPEEYSIETIPPPMHVSAPFASYSAVSIAQNDTMIVFIRKLEFQEQEISPENYLAYRSFCSDMVKSDKGKIVLKRKN